MSNQANDNLNPAASILLDEGSGRLEGFCESLKTLSNPHRLRILLSLLSGEASVGDLESELNLKQPNLSHELRKLRDKGMVKTRRQSKVIFYSIADQNTANLIEDVLLLFSGERKLNQPHENPRVSSTAGSFTDSESPGECGRFPLVHQP
ncbi:MAG: metalloregulator ArsR/SmtB family transcription factor [bacterium]